MFNCEPGKDREQKRSGRRRVRWSYACECAGDLPGPGRIEGHRTDGIRSAIRDLTGDVVLTCPWRALYDPFVRRVIDVVALRDQGGLAHVAAPATPSNRLVEGIRHYVTRDNRVHAAMLDLQRQNDRKVSGGRDR